MNKENAVPVYSIKCQPAITMKFHDLLQQWMDLAYNLISEIKQTEKYKDHTISLMWDQK